MENINILLVDDEPITRRVTSNLLNRHYRTIEAENVEQATKRLELAGIEIGLVITDILMPNGNGIDLIEEMAKNYGHIPILVSTGNITTHNYFKMIENDIIFGIIEKPWEKDLALKTIGEALESYKKIR